MATFRDPKKFAKRMFFISSKVKKNAENAVKKAALAADRAAVMATPVDTGRARANWLVSVGKPRLGEEFFDSMPGGKTSNEGPAASQALDQGRAAIMKYKLGKGGIFISNSVHYIQRLESGSSAQAPGGMTAAALMAARRQLGTVRLLKGT
ncbi:MAG: hypothetical protein GY906_12175 [bacterium]|nr:hypothetical protein [bacterium]